MKNILLLLILIFCQNLYGQEDSPLYLNSDQTEWVDSIYESLSLDEKIGQLFMVAAYSNKDLSHENDIKKLITNQHIGGLIFMQDSPKHQVELLNAYQKLTKVPLLIGMDAEWDISMRLKNTNQFPWAMTAGALQDDTLLHDMGSKVSEHLKLVGAQFNFAPVVDVNVNPLNPIIGNRSYGSDPDNVSKKGIAYANGMQENNILAAAKHFPGHGDTDKDSHKTLPTIMHSIARLDSIELKPFQYLIDNGISSIMIAHLNVPSLETQKNVPASLSKNIVTDLLKEKMGFKGIIITDALNMEGVTKHYPDGETDYRAFEAGNDILLFSQAVGKGKKKIKDALENGTITQERLEESVKKILMAKYFAGLNDIKELETTDLDTKLNDIASRALTQRIFEESATLIKNENDLLPLVDLNQKFGWIGLEEGTKSTFFNYLNKYMQVDKISQSNAYNPNITSEYDCIFISIHKDNSSPYKSYKISKKSRDLIKQLAKRNRVVLTIFGSPYAFKDFEDTNLESIIIGYQNHEFAQQAIPQLIYGAIPFQGKLPVELNEKYTYGSCIETSAIDRLGYTFPENVNVSTEKLKAIDKIAEDAIARHATPGMQIVLAKNGKVIFDKTYGTFTYGRKNAVAWNDLYDVASVTKVVSTLPLLMDQVQKKELNLATPFRNLVPRSINSDKADVTVKEALSHQGGFYPWIPFYKSTIDSISTNPLSAFYSNTKIVGFETEVANQMFLVNHYQDSMLNYIFKKESVPKRYAYSDLPYYLFKDYLERSKLEGIDKQVYKSFYNHMGMNYTTYNPLRKFGKEQIVPTENDKSFRHQIIQGHVHDQGAAMLGGVAGHAGIFSNANDLAKMMQMYLNGGNYGGRQFIEPSVLKEFTKYQYKSQGNRRGLGFDKQIGNKGPAIPEVSSAAFGHTGFTGTMVWADPKEDIIFIFLSNRTYPSSENRKLIKMKTRKKILKKFYEAL